jgi:hypothetical protein
MQAKQSHLRRRIYNTVPGFLHGPCPKGPIVTVWHKQSGRTGFWLYWKGSWHDSFGQQDLYKLFGISPRVKMTGAQQGYPSEPLIQAVKYRALQQAVLCIEKRQGSASAVLATRSIPAEVMAMACMLDVVTVEVLD